LPTITKIFAASGEVTANAAGSLDARLGADADEEFSVSFLRPKELFLIVGDVLTSALSHAVELKRLCGNFLADKNSFWIPTAIVSDEFEITYSSRSKGNLGLTADAGARIEAFVKAKFGLSTKGDVTEKGAIRYKGDRLFIGFREAYPVELLTGRTATFSGNEDVTSLRMGDFVYASDQ
jgi:hypothetical protein